MKAPITTKLVAAITLFLASVLLPSGSSFAATTTEAETSSTAIVVPGGTNSDAFEVTIDVTLDLQDVYVIATSNVDFTAITSDSNLGSFSFAGDDSQAIGASGLTVSFPNGGYSNSIGVRTYLERYAVQMVAGETFAIGLDDYPTVGKQLRLSFAPGSISFSESGPWEIQVLAFYTDTPGTDWPPGEEEYLYINLTEPTAAAPSSPTSTSSSVSGDPGIFLTVTGRVGYLFESSEVVYGAYAVAPNSAYQLSVQSITNPTVVNRVLASGRVNSGGHLEATTALPRLAAGNYKITFIGTAANGVPLKLTNHVNVDERGRYTSISAERLQPFLP